MGKTEISWADEVWNPVRGCSRVSEGCRHCYAETTAARFSGPGQPYEGLVTRKLKVISDDEQRMEARWTGDVRFVASALAEPLKRKKPTRYFVNSMSDLFHDGFTNQQIAAVFGVMAACPRHTFMVLTKRPQRMREWFEWVEKRGEDGKSLFPGDDREDQEWRIWQMLNVAAHRSGAEKMPNHHGGAWPLPNVWLGVSVENQAAADERIPLLLQTPAAVRFISAEPLLGPVQLPVVHVFGPAAKWDGPKIDWVIAGCESGHGARPCEVSWLRSLRDQCTSAGVAFWLKQAAATYPTQESWEAELESPEVGGAYNTAPTPVVAGEGSKRKQGGIIELPYLDGVQWTQLPEVKS